MKSLWIVLLCVVALTFPNALPVSTGVPAEEGDAPRTAEPGEPLYRVTIAADDPADRTRLGSLGIAIDSVLSDQAITYLDAAGLDRALALGLRIESVEPLDFPPGDAAYHNLDEMVAEIDRAAASHPDIVRVSSIGTSVEGRALLSVKISDDPDSDDPDEPAVLFFALTHAREHLTTEMALAIIQLFTDGYGSDPAITNLVNHREIWILPNVNPDGGEYDVASGYYTYWRKNRTLNADGSRGVDLNRNYGYRWGGEGASSFAGAETYRGLFAFSEPETRAIRDFVVAHGDISAAIAFHTYGERILYPFGYTYEDLPTDMDATDRDTFRALATEMAASNGYVAEQSSDLYLISGDSVDWLYGARGVFAFTFEMYPKTSTPGFYPPATVIGDETQRNESAVRYLTAMADHPERSLGRGGDLAAPQVTLVASGSRWDEGDPAVTIDVAADDDTGVTLLALQAGAETQLLGGAVAGTLAWTPPGPGDYPLIALAFDAAGNEGASATYTLTARSPATATLEWSEDAAAVDVTAPLALSFSRPIDADSLRLTFDPPVDFQLQQDGEQRVLIVHAPFAPLAEIRLLLADGEGPYAFVLPAEWTFTTAPWRLHLPWTSGSVP